MNNTIANLETEIKRNHTNAEAYYNRGNLYSKIGKHAEVIIDYAKAVELNPEFA